MESYPLGKVNFATSVTTASLASQSLFLSATINTASVALNFSGSRGPSGSVYTKFGSDGPNGSVGPQGPKGLGVYLLSSSRASCCNRFDSFFNWIASADSFGLDQCDTNKYTYSLGAFINSTCSSLDDGCPVYSDSSCQSILLFRGITDGSGQYYVLSNGNISGAPQSCSL